jgi:DNA polymerase-3 subunit gamma/tau
MALNCRTAIGSSERPTPEPCGVCDSCIEVRQGNAVDVIEIDAATNRGIDEIRELRDAARYSPARDRYKIYILDEAHQITEAAFNALLKTLEEPPAHVIFMMATTEPENIPQTIRSRCQHFSFHAVKFDDILAQLKMIAAQEQVEAEDAALALLAEAGDGSMRDALSIMDQAIASAPLENDRPKLATAQIRELMGSVPNAIFERLLETVAQGQSAELMEQLNVLVNAGHSPSSLARQMVRYLRNALMAKLGGEQTELLQISADERSRAARTALLFTEEELTRNLQIILRTFDDLNYRQEQRFHLELGVLKLIHAQRLLPIEELLSGASGGSNARGPAATSSPRSTPSPARHASATQVSPVLAPSPRPLESPFESSNWNPAAKSTAIAETNAVAEKVAVAEISAVPVRATVAPMPRPSPSPEPAFAPTPMREATPFAPSSSAAPEYAETLTEGSLAKAPQSAVLPPAAPPAVDVIRQAVRSALDAAGHASAAQLLGAATWTQDGSSLRMEAPMGKKMLGLTVNAAAEKIIRQELLRLGAPTRFLIVPGDGAVSLAVARSAPLAGSVEEAALAHPLVQRAREIFNAEVRTVLDLRVK